MKSLPSPPGPFWTPLVLPIDPSTFIAKTRSFVLSDFGIANNNGNFNKDIDNDDSLFSRDFCWVNSDNLNNGDVLTGSEYIAAGRFFDLRGSFPDLNYRPYDFRIDDYDCDSNNVGDINYANNDIDYNNKEEITVRFTTLTTGTFRGRPLRLRSSLIPPNGKVMKCPPTSVGVTFALKGEDKGKIIRLVDGMVLDPRFGNTDGLTGIAAAAKVAGLSVEPSLPPWLAVERKWKGSRGMVEERNDNEDYLPPYPEQVMIQLARGVTASNFGLEEPGLLSEDFEYVEPLIGPMDKATYCRVFGEFDVKGAVPNLEYRFRNFRIDPYDPQRVWVDTRARGTRIGSIGTRIARGNAEYRAPPESMSFTFDKDGFCIRMTAGAPLDPLLGNTGGLGGVYGLLYATGTPETPFKTRPINSMLNRVQKVAFQAITKTGIDEYLMSDGRIIRGNKPPLKTSNSSTSFTMPTPPKVPPPVKESAKKAPFFAVPKTTRITPSPPGQKVSTFTLPKPVLKENQLRLSQQEASGSVMFPKPIISEITPTTSSLSNTAASAISKDKITELREAAAAARAEAKEAKKLAEQKAASNAKDISSKSNSVSTVGVTSSSLKGSFASSILGDLKFPPASSIISPSTRSSTASSSLGSTPQSKLRTQVQKKKMESKGSTIAGIGGGTVSKKSQGTEKGSRKKIIVSPMEKVIKSSGVSKPVRDPTETTKSPTFSLFGDFDLTSKPQQSNVAKKKNSESRGTTKPPTISIFGIVEPRSKPKPLNAAKKTSSVESRGTTKAPAVSLFVGAELKNKSTGNSFLRDLFGNGPDSDTISTGSSKISTRPTPKKIGAVASSSSNTGVPSLKQWKINPDNSVEGRIFGSRSFKDGATVTTSPIRKVRGGTMVKGNIVQTTSGSKYLLS